jgi:hypothetical protein
MFRKDASKKSLNNNRQFGGYKERDSNSIEKREGNNRAVIKGLGGAQAP